MKKDVWGHEARYKNWKERAVTEGEGIPELNKRNSDILIKHILDFEMGFNISSKNKKGGRSYPRLNSIRQRLTWLFKKFEERGIKDITKIQEKQVFRLFSDMASGAIKTEKGEQYKSISDYVSIFTSFWHWWMKINRKKGIEIRDICEDLDKSPADPAFVYLSKEQTEELMHYLPDKEDQLIVYFVFDSLIRTPVELASLKVKNIYQKNGEVWVNIPIEISKTKTFARDFNLLYTGPAILEHIKEKQLNPEDYLFDYDPRLFNKKLQKAAVQCFGGDKVSHPTAKGKYSELTLYDFRHNGAIHLRNLAKKNGKISLDTIRHRGGWKDFRRLDYYTKFIGLDGSIDRNDLLIEEDKIKIVRDVEKLQKSDKRTAKILKVTLEMMRTLAEKNPELMKPIIQRYGGELKEALN